MPLFALFRMHVKLAFPTRQVEAAPWSLLGLFRLSTRPCLWHKYRWVQLHCQFSITFAILWHTCQLDCCLWPLLNSSDFLSFITMFANHHSALGPVLCSLLHCCSSRGSRQGYYTTRRKWTQKLTSKKKLPLTTPRLMVWGIVLFYVFDLFASLLPGTPEMCI